MRALVVVHEPGSEAVLVGDRLRHHGYDLVEFRVTNEVGDPVGSLDGVGSPTDYDLIVPMGSVHSLTDTDRIAGWIHDELDLLRRADSAGVPVLGVCFGGQALAAAHGGRVVRSERAQIGWHPLTPVLSCPHLTGPWMQWHVDRFEPPTDAEILAADHIGVQAFTLRRNLGLQFHPEVTPTHVDRWLDGAGRDELLANGLDPDDLLAETVALQADVAPRTEALVDWFLADVARR